MIEIGIITFAVIGAAFIIIAIRAPLGFEDPATGFHLGEISYPTKTKANDRNE